MTQKKTHTHVATAEQLARENDGIVPDRAWLKRNGHYGLVIASYRFPDAFAHLTFEKKRLTIEELVVVAEKLAKDNNGQVPCCQWLQANGYSGVYAAIRQYPEQFNHLVIAKGDVKGANNGMFGRTHTADARAKISKVATGRKHTDEWKREMSERLRGKPSAMLGKKHTEEAKKKISESVKKTHATPEVKAKLGHGNSFRGKHHTPESKRKLALAHLGMKSERVIQATKEAVELYLDGKLMKEIAADLELNQETIRAYLKSADVEMRDDRELGNGRRKIPYTGVCRHCNHVKEEHSDYLCRRCYFELNPKIGECVNCIREMKIFALGMCMTCWSNQNLLVCLSCEKLRPAAAKGLCKRCYERENEPLVGRKRNSF